MKLLRGHRYVVAGVVAVVAVACGVGLGNLSERGPQEPLPLTDHFVSALAPAGKLEVGEECTQFQGNSACESDLCLRVAPGFPPKGFCSIRCSPGDDDACPDAPTAWRCQQLFPSPDGWACAPHKSHASAKATRKGAKVFGPPRATPGASADGGAP